MGHLASGGAGGGMRWPNRKPHVLTPGMRQAQAALDRFLPLIDWSRFSRVNLNEEVKALSRLTSSFCCSDGRQAVLWLLRRDTIGADGRLRRDAPPISTMVRIPGMGPGRYRITAVETMGGERVWAGEGAAKGGVLTLSPPPITTDLALAVTPA
jgi:mannan endo-1,4-beta-mannosidase